MNWLIENGLLLPADKPEISHTNRAFLYGDGCFESIRVGNGKVLNAGIHFLRLERTLRALEIQLPEGYDQTAFENELSLLVEKNEIKSGGRIRATFSRAGGGHFTPERNEAHRVMAVVALQDGLFALNKRRLSVDIYAKIKKEVDYLANFKTLNCQLYVMAAIHSKNQGLDDAILLNASGGIMESTNSNLFVVSNRVLYTPGLDQGCVAGVMRMKVINLALSKGLKVYECNISPQHLLSADELLLTNAISGIRWVSAYRTKRYLNNMAGQLIKWLNEEIY